MFYGSEPLTQRQRRRRRLIGAAAIALLTAVLITLQVRDRRRSPTQLAPAFDALAAVVDDPVHRAEHKAAAERFFRRGVGSFSVDPMALIGLAILEHFGRKPPPSSPDPAALGERGVVDHIRLLLEAGRPDRALAYAQRAREAIGRTDALGQIQVFAELWQEARRTRLKTADRPSSN